MQNYVTIRRQITWRSYTAVKQYGWLSGAMFLSDKGKVVPVL